MRTNLDAVMKSLPTPALSEAQREDLFASITKDFHEQIHRYLKRGYWTYVEESLREAMIKARREWPGQGEIDG